MQALCEAALREGLVTVSERYASWENLGYEIQTLRDSIEPEIPKRLSEEHEYSQLFEDWLKQVELILDMHGRLEATAEVSSKHEEALRDIREITEGNLTPRGKLAAIEDELDGVEL